MIYRMAKHVMSKEELAIAMDCLMRAEISKKRPICTVAIHYPEPRVTPMTLPHAEAFDGTPYAYKFLATQVSYGVEGYAPIKGVTFNAIVCGDLIMQMAPLR